MTDTNEGQDKPKTDQPAGPTIEQQRIWQLEQELSDTRNALLAAQNMPVEVVNRPPRLTHTNVLACLCQHLTHSPVATHHECPDHGHQLVTATYEQGE